VRVRIPQVVRSAGWRVGKRAVDWSARHLRLASYVPAYDYREQLDAHTTYAEDRRAVRDKRPSTVGADDVDLTLTVDGLADIVGGRDWLGKRILEVGPKYGTHAIWIDEHLRPSELVFSDFAADRHLHEGWEARLSSPHSWVYGDLRLAGELLERAPFDVVFFLGVLYHSAFHLPLLGMLNRVTRPGGEMLLETTIDPRPDAAVRIRWQRGTGKAKAVPTLDALRIELAWTGWRDVTRFVDYRPGSDEVVLLCRKTDELPAGAELIDLVAPQRPRVEALEPWR
jgi:SAM-dependent methyltransferase